MMMIRASCTFLGVALIGVTMLAKAATEPLPDPTRPAGYSARKPADQELPREIVNWNVTAIRIAGTERSAIINGQLVKVGDRIGKGMVLEINHEGVVLDYNRQQLVIGLLPYSIKKSQSTSD